MVIAADSILENVGSSQASVALSFNPSYLGGIEVGGQPQQIVPDTPISKITKAKLTGV
jgi:hypothetical protein